MKYFFTILLVTFSFGIIKGQNEEVKRTTIINSLGVFFDNLSYLNDESEPLPADVFESTFGNENILTGGGNYFRVNGHDFDMVSFIKNYSQKNLEGRNINHKFDISHRKINVKPMSQSSDDQRWQVNGILKRSNANFKKDSKEDFLIKDEPMSFIVRYNGEGKEISILEINIENPNIQKVYPVYTNDTIFTVDNGQSKTHLSSNGGEWHLKMNSYCIQYKSYPGFYQTDKKISLLDYSLIKQTGKSRIDNIKLVNGIITGSIPQNYSENNRSYSLTLRQNNTNRQQTIVISQSGAVTPCYWCDFFDVDNFYNFNQFDLSYSIKYGIGISYRCHLEDTRFSFGGLIATNFDTYRGWESLEKTVKQNIEPSIGGSNIIKGDMYKVHSEIVKPETSNYSSLMDPYNSARKYTARSIFLLQAGVTITNWFSFNMGAGVALSRNKYFLETAYGYTKYSFEKLDPMLPDIEDIYSYRAYYKDYYYKDPIKVHFAMRPSLDFRIPIQWDEYLNLGLGYVVTPGYKEGCSLDFSIGYTWSF